MTKKGFSREDNLSTFGVNPLNSSEQKALEVTEDEIPIVVDAADKIVGETKEGVEREVSTKRKRATMGLNVPASSVRKRVKPPKNATHVLTLNAMFSLAQEEQEREEREIQDEEGVFFEYSREEYKAANEFFSVLLAGENNLYENNVEALDLAMNQYFLVWKQDLRNKFFEKNKSASEGEFKNYFEDISYRVKYLFNFHKTASYWFDFSETYKLGPSPGALDAIKTFLDSRDFKEKMLGFLDIYYFEWICGSRYEKITLLHDLLNKKFLDRGRVFAEGIRNIDDSIDLLERLIMELSSNKNAKIARFLEWRNALLEVKENKYSYTRDQALMFEEMYKYFNKGDFPDRFSFVSEIGEKIETMYRWYRVPSMKNKGFLEDEEWSVLNDIRQILRNTCAMFGKIKKADYKYLKERYDELVLISKRADFKSGILDVETVDLFSKVVSGLESILKGENLDVEIESSRNMLNLYNSVLKVHSNEKKSMSLSKAVKRKAKEYAESRYRINSTRTMPLNDLKAISSLHQKPGVGVPSSYQGYFERTASDRIKGLEREIEEVAYQPDEVRFISKWTDFVGRLNSLKERNPQDYKLFLMGELTFSGFLKRASDYDFRSDFFNVYKILEDRSMRLPNWSLIENGDFNQFNEFLRRDLAKMILTIIYSKVKIENYEEIFKLYESEKKRLSPYIWQYSILKFLYTFYFKKVKLVGGEQLEYFDSFVEREILNFVEDFEKNDGRSLFANVWVLRMFRSFEGVLALKDEYNFQAPKIVIDRLKLFFENISDILLKDVEMTKGELEILKLILDYAFDLKKRVGLKLPNDDVMYEEIVDLLEVLN